MTTPLPTDRGHIETEQRHDASNAFDTLGTRAALDLLRTDHEAVLDALDGAEPELAAFIDGLVERMERGGRLVYIGAGTSGRLGVLDASECPPTFHSEPEQVIGVIAGGDNALRVSSETKEDDPHGAHEALDALKLDERDTLLGIAAGGTTPYVLGALSIAKQTGSATALLTCAPGIDEPKDCDTCIRLDTKAEILTGSTRLKAGTATKIALNMITTIAFTKLGKVYGNLMVDMKATNDKLTDRAIRILQTLAPELDRPAAAEMLERAGHDLKTAIVMARLNVDRAEATTLLKAHHGRLRAIIDR